MGCEHTNWIFVIASALHGRLLIKPELFMVCSHIAWLFLLNDFFFAGYPSNIYIAPSCFILFCFFRLTYSSVLQGHPGANLFIFCFVFIYFHILSWLCLFIWVFTSLFTRVGNCWFVLSIHGRQELAKDDHEILAAEEYQGTFWVFCCSMLLSALCRTKISRREVWNYSNKSQPEATETPKLTRKKPPAATDCQHHIAAAFGEIYSVLQLVLSSARTKNSIREDWTIRTR